MLAACGKDEQGRRDYVIVLALLDTGQRASEFMAMGVGDVGRDSIVKVIGKGRKERYTRLGARARKAVLRYLMT